jgi:succinoglycan biosynthesis protein ExoO
MRPKPPDSSAPVVSVIMANYNGATYLAEAVESVQRQSLLDLEIIVSDDASTDNSVTIATGLMAKDARIRLVQSEHNAGPGAARNRALAVAKGEWIAVIDSDDLMHPTRLATLVEAARRDGADMVADDLIQFSSDESFPPKTLLTGSWIRGPAWVDIVDYIELNQLYGPGPMLGYLKPLFRASALRGLSSGYDETLRIGEDYHLVIRLLHSGNRMRVHPLPLYFYRKHESSTSHRLNESALVALKIADQRFLTRVSRSDRRLVAAVAARIRSIDTALAYEELLNALKTRNWSTSARIMMTRPQAAALLRLPVGVRLRRLLPWRLQDFRSKTQSQPCSTVASGICDGIHSAGIAKILGTQAFRAAIERCPIDRN